MADAGPARLSHPGQPPPGYPSASAHAIRSYHERSGGQPPTQSSAHTSLPRNESEDHRHTRSGPSDHCYAMELPARRRPAEYEYPSLTHRRRSAGSETDDADDTETEFSYGTASDMSRSYQEALGDDWPDDMTSGGSDMGDETVNDRALDLAPRNIRTARRSAPTSGIQGINAFADVSPPPYENSVGRSAYLEPAHGYSTPGWPSGSRSVARESTKKCVVCKAKPVYRTPGGATPYPTCGLRCAATLDKQTRTSHQSSTSKRLSKCTVCKVKDQYYNKVTGKSFPTCGNTCAAILKSRSTGRLTPANAFGVCEQCHKKPKAASKTTGRPYAFCSRECRDKQNAMLGKAIAGTCQTCIICFRSAGLDEGHPYCGEECRVAAGSLAPTMIEVPKGHVMFEKYNRRFLQGCDTSSDNQPAIKHMYVFVQASGVQNQYADYKDGLGAAHRRGRTPVQKELWAHLTRDCDTGDSGEIDHCSSPSCELCVVACNGFQRSMFPCGVVLRPTPTSPSAAIPAVVRRARRTTVAVFVRLAQEAKGLPGFTAQQLSARAQDIQEEYAVVKIIEKKGRRSVETGELRVFQLAAILPLGCIVYA